MNIALIAPSPVPFVAGGAEKLLTSMHYFADKMSAHHVELIKVPTREHDFWNIIDAYKTFYDMDLSHFDAIISQKYPAWMLRHPQHTVYMLHRLRGLYDTYPVNYAVNVDTAGNKYLALLLHYMDAHPLASNEIDNLFALLQQLRYHATDLDPTLFCLPGPLIRRLVRFMDDWALHPSRITRYAAISDTVRRRPGYFPNLSIVETIYPASPLDGLAPSSLGDYLFTASRLDYAKRLDLIIAAFKQSTVSNRLLIAGTGPAEAELRTMAAGDARIKFLGYVSNDALVNYYRGCYGVLYIPKEEDYGYITIEAMQCAKPVITCSDSGGALEFIKDKETGLVADPTPSSLANAINLLFHNHSEAKTMGRNAFERVKSITWSNSMNKLLQFNEKLPKIKALALSTYDVFPRQHGGQLRVYNIHKNLHQHFNTTIFSIGQTLPREIELGGIREIIVNVSVKHKQIYGQIASAYPIPVEDIVMAELLQHSPHIADAFQSEYEKADVIFLEHPYLASLLPTASCKPVIYNAHNVEYLLKKSMLGDKADDLLDKVKAIEQLACDQATFILACSEGDMQNFISLYGVDPKKILLLPNGVDCSDTAPAYADDRMRNRAKLNIPNESIATFIGSYHKPNIDAVKHILAFAKELPDVSFIIMGGVGRAYMDSDIPDNVVMPGLVDDITRDTIFRVAGVAINPMDSGSGSNLKLAEYMCHGLPVVTTAIGARGYGIIDGKTAILSDVDAFPSNIRQVLAGGHDIHAMELAANEYIRSNFDWPIMVQRILPALLAKLDKKSLA